MDFSILESKIEARGIQCLRDEPMRRHSSFRIGGPAALLALPGTEDELRWLCGLTPNPLIIGNGTNLLVTDAPLKRLVIKTTELCTLSAQGDCLFAGAGALLSRTALFAAERGLTGLEFAHGIPGSLGGAVVMNAGAYGGEMGRVIQSTRFLNEDLEIQELTGEAQCFSYRSSFFSDKNCVVLSAKLHLSPSDPAVIRAQMAELMQKRRNSQPLDKPSAGSTFKRPVGGYAAALIDQAGLKGFSIGGAQVSEKHAGFVVNKGGASFYDVLRLMEYIQKTVMERFGVELQPEVRVIGG